MQRFLKNGKRFFVLHVSKGECYCIDNSTSYVKIDEQCSNNGRDDSEQSQTI